MELRHLARLELKKRRLLQELHTQSDFPHLLRRRQSCFALLQDRDDLLFAVSRAFHCGSPPGFGRTHILPGPVFGGWVKVNLKNLKM